ncbi:hypothetical protein QR680_014200 [Steinernema hermaphroditum]|uniref:F-box domain-containing protein n=1 Tax=Steinernema hermaphroditum TaxID=289476 RepID=A0AA39I831_9BILA|nr:hypothetical protein QR680_014200 [Steinernema hermaphroditum]
MDTVPYIFIDRVVELFDSLTLTSSLASRLKKGTWRNVLHLHRRNRRYYELGVRIRNSNIECLVRISSWTAEEIEKEDNSPTLHVETTELDRKFVRIREISNYSSYETGIPQLTFRQDEVDKVLKFMLPFYVYGNINCYMLHEPLIETQFLECAFGKMYFTILDLDYSAEAENILKEHIDNFPYLHVVHLGESWPDTILPHIKKFIFQKGKSLTAGFTSPMFSGNEIEEIVKFWKENYEHEFSLCYTPRPDDEQRFLKQMIPYKETEFYCENAHYLLNAQRKHIVRYKKFGKMHDLEFMECCCGTVKNCKFKQAFPKLHTF